MSYLAKPERKALILSAAIDMTLKEGLESLTARSVTMHAGISTGQIYHHYQSISELRAEVFKTISSQYFQESLKTGLNAYDLLIFMLLPDESEDIRSYLKLWRDAEKLIEKDQLLHLAYQKAIDCWHSLLTDTLEKGVSENIFTINCGSANEVAWRLIATSFGLEKLLTAKPTDFKNCHVSMYLKVFVNHEIKLKKSIS